MLAHRARDERADLARDRVHREGRHRGRRRLATPGPAVVFVERELAADRLAALHQDPETAPDVAVKRIHAPRAAAGRGEEVLCRGQPPLVRQELQGAGLEQRPELGAELALGRLHHPERPELPHAPQRRRVGLVDHVPHGHAASGLLQREVAEAREHERQLLLVVGPPRCLRRALDEHDAELARRRARKRPHGVGQLVVGYEKPPAPGRVHTV